MRKLLLGDCFHNAQPAQRFLEQRRIYLRMKSTLINIRSPPLHAGKFVMGATKKLLQHHQP
jgi:hypothetical protein